MDIKEACVLLRIAGKHAGTGFFVTPRWIATCAHCVDSLGIGDTLEVVALNDQRYVGTLRAKMPEQRHVVQSWPDVALIELSEDIGTPVVLEAEVPNLNEQVRTFGFPRDSDGGEDGIAYYEGRQQPFGKSTARLKLRQTQILFGMSGGPVYVPGDPPRVIGIIVATDGATREAGGIALAAVDLKAALAPYVDLQVQSLRALTASAQPDFQNFDRPVAALQTVSSPSVQGPAGKVLSLIDGVDRARRQGKLETARRLAEAAVEHEQLLLLPPSLQAKAKRALATVIAESGSNFKQARRLADEAEVLDSDPVAVTRVAAIIARFEFGPEEALLVITPGLSPDLETLRAVYFLELGNSADARDVLRTLPGSELDKPRVRRLKLMVAMEGRNREESLRLAEGLVAAGSDDAAIAFSVIQAFVYGSYPVELWPRHFIAWPQPLPTSEVVEDPEQPARLRQAALLAEALAANDEIEEKDFIQTWAFAAYALNRDERRVAEDKARQLLAEARPNYRIIPWIQALRLGVDIAPAVEKITANVDDGRATPEEILVLVSVIMSEDSDRAEKLLKRNEKHFAGETLHSRWALFLAQCRLAHGDRASALVAIDQISDPDDRHSAELLLLDTDDDFEKAIARLIKLWNSKGDAIALLIAVEVAHRHGNWQFIAEHGKPLLAAFLNANAARFAMYASYNTQRYTDVLERYAELVSTGTAIPSDLERLRVLALDALGDATVGQAFEKLLETDPSNENYLLAGQSRMRSGDYASIVLLARRVVLSPAATAKTLLFYSAWVRTENEDLARSLWRRAMSLGVPADELVSIAFFLAHQLGISNETQLLQEPMVRLGSAGEGGLRMLSSQEAFEVLRESAKHSADLFQQYRRGEIAVHLLCAGSSLSLIRTHVEQPRANASGTPRTVVPIFVRHGGASVDTDRLLERSGLYLDVTSYLVAVDLGVLENLLDVYSRLYIPADMGALFASAYDQAAQGRPKLNFVKEMLDAVTDGALKAVNTEHDTVDNIAIQMNALLCDWATPDSGAAHAISGVRWCSPRRIIDALLRRGLIGNDAHAAAIAALGNIQEDVGDDPPPTIPILLRFNVAEMLQECGVLRMLAAEHVVYLEDAYLTHSRNELRKADHEAHLASWLSSLIERFRVGLEDGSLRMVPNAQLGMAEDALETRCLYSMFGTLEDGTSISVDDRFVTGWSARDDGIPVASLWDILQGLAASGKLPKDKFIALTLEMRRRGMMYIPINKDEILHHVSIATVNDGELVVSEGMRVLTHYVATALLDGEALYATSGSGIGARRSQAAFLFSLSRAVRAAVARLAEGDSPDDELRANWVHRYLSPDGLPGYGLSGFLPNAAAEAVIDVELANALTEYVTP